MAINRFTHLVPLRHQVSEAAEAAGEEALAFPTRDGGLAWGVTVASSLTGGLSRSVLTVDEVIARYGIDPRYATMTRRYTVHNTGLGYGVWDTLQEKWWTCQSTEHWGSDARCHFEVELIARKLEKRRRP